MSSCVLKGTAPPLVFFQNAAKEVDDDEAEEGFKFAVEEEEEEDEGVSFVPMPPCMGDDDDDIGSEGVDPSVSVLGMSEVRLKSSSIS